MSFVNGSVAMNDIPVFDARRPRYGEGMTAASSHPELVSGDFAIPPRPHVSITAINRLATYDRRRAIGGTFAMVAIAVLLSTVAFKSAAISNSGDVEKQKFARTCMQWHLAAGAVVSRLVQSTRDADLVQVGDSVFRMRRGRRNCEAGWVTLACQDYHSVATSLRGHAVTNELFPCTRVAAVSDDGD
jgi:hypothetical protein